MRIQIGRRLLQRARRLWLQSTKTSGNVRSIRKERLNKLDSMIVPQDADAQFCMESEEEEEEGEEGEGK